MVADPSRTVPGARPASRPLPPRRTPRARGAAAARGLRASLGAAVAALLLSSGLAGAATPADEPPEAGKAAAGGAKRPSATHAWVDRGVRRPLSIDPGWRADFSAALRGRPVALRRAEAALPDVSPALQSPVFRDEGGRARALPGGVVVVLDAALDDADARALIARHGAAASRRIADRVWLVESPAGMASLELANRLADTGAFTAAQPNWWVERALK